MKSIVLIIGFFISFILCSGEFEGLAMSYSSIETSHKPSNLPGPITLELITEDGSVAGEMLMRPTGYFAEKDIIYCDIQLQFVSRETYRNTIYFLIKNRQGDVLEQMTISGKYITENDLVLGRSIVSPTLFSSARYALIQYADIDDGRREPGDLLMNAIATQ